MQLDATAAAAGIGLICHDDIDSTNAEALRLARAGEFRPLWVVARTQQAGRGRRGRGWVSAAGNLHATLLLVDPAEAQLAPQLSFVAALALYDAVVRLAPELAPRLALKWPNDLLCDGIKLAGILIEGEGARPLLVAVGIGVNCIGHPNLDYPATDLRACGAAVSADDLFGALSEAMVRRLAQWDRGGGFAEVRADWLQRAALSGREVCVRLADRDINGRAEAIDAAGRLILRRADGETETIAAADVFPVHRVANESARDFVRDP